MNARQKLHQIHLQEWTVRFADQKASGLTVRQWCEQNNLSFHTYNYWKHLLKEEVVDQTLPDIVPLYSINQEEYLRVFLSDGNVPMDNNYAEQAIRPFTIGRKNFVMVESSTGAKASAILYSLVETAKANMLNTFEYFNLLLTEIPQHMDDKDLMFIDDLLPWSPRIQKECPSRYKKT